MKSKLIQVNGTLIGIVGLDEIFTEFFDAGEKPAKALQTRLLEKFKEYNYIPKTKEENYALVLMKENMDNIDEIKEFCNRKRQGVEEKEASHGTWQGVPREEVPWFPTIMEELCDGCKICLNFCSFGVYEYDEKTSKVKVIHPFNCQVGCSICVLKCKPKAISFPPLSILGSFRKR